METKKVNLIDYFYVLVKWRKLIIVNFIVVSILAIIFSLLVPKWYQSNAVVMPPEADLKNLGVASLLSKLPIGGLGIPIGGNEVMNFIAIMKSRTVMEILIDRFDLIALYEKKNIDLALLALQNNIEITLGDEGQIHLGVLDKSPARAKAMAETILASLDSIYTQMNIQKARNDRVFIEQRFNQNKIELSKAEERLRAFQEKYGVIDIPEQTRAAIANAAELQGSIYATEVELRIKQKQLASNHAEILQDKVKLSELQKKLSELRSGKPGVNGDLLASGELFLPFDIVPEVGLEYIRLFREVEVQNRIFEFLIQIYEQAKIEEARDLPALQVLDPPSLPIYKAKPKRAVIVIVAALFSLIITALFAFFKEFLSGVELRDDEQSQKVAWIRQQVRSDFAFFRRKKN